MVVRILLTWYMDQRAGVLWNGSFSYRFSSSNGVRQGGVSSPMFLIYFWSLRSKELVVSGITILLVLYAMQMMLLSSLLQHLFCA